LVAYYIGGKAKLSSANIKPTTLDSCHLSILTVPVPRKVQKYVCILLRESDSRDSSLSLGRNFVC